MELRQNLLGCVRYLPDRNTDGHSLLIAVRCSIGEVPNEVEALLDCAAEWSVLSTTVAISLGVTGEAGGWPLEMSTRFGRFEGSVVNLPVTLIADRGENVTIPVKWFVCDYWFGPTVLGWRGCLDSLDFALSQSRGEFFFAPAEPIGAA